MIVLDDAQVEEVVLGREGILGAIAPGGAIVFNETSRSPWKLPMRRALVVCRFESAP